MTGIPQLDLNPTTMPSEARDWHENAKKLTDWTLEHMVNRPDIYGYYYNAEGIIRGIKKDGSVNDTLINGHFAGDKTIGLYTTSVDDRCRWLAIDMDRHEGDPEDFETRNHEYACRIFEQLRSLGFAPLLYDSNGKGGRHLFVIFDRPEPAYLVRRFGRWLVRNWEEAGFQKQPEVFPKQDSIRQ